MDTITLNNGVEMPALGLGVFPTPTDETPDAARRARRREKRLWSGPWPIATVIGCVRHPTARRKG
jgi:hypothetical protein